MTTIKRFEDLDAWKVARELDAAVYRATESGPISRDFPFRDQIRSAALSTMSNIAEGFEREGTAEFLQFLSIAKGSSGEVGSLLYAALGRKYVTQAAFDDLQAKVVSTRRLIIGLMSYLRRTPFKGYKYKRPANPQTSKPANP